MIYAPARAAIEQKAPVAARRALVERQFHIRIVLFHGVAQQGQAFRRFAQRIQIAHQQIGREAQRFQVLQPRVRGDHKIFRRARKPARREFSRANDPAGSRFRVHGKFLRM